MYGQTDVKANVYTEVRTDKGKGKGIYKGLDLRLSGQTSVYTREGKKKARNRRAEGERLKASE